MVRGRLMGQASKRDDYNCPCLMTNGPVLCWKEVVFYQLASKHTVDITGAIIVIITISIFITFHLELL